MINHNKHNDKKKVVPDWLNSSIWSSPSPSPSPAAPPPDSATTYATESAEAPPPPPPPPVRTHPNGVAAAADTKSDASISPCHSSAPPSPSLSPSPSPDEIARQAQLLLELSKKVINLREIRRLASMSIPDAPGIRPTVWKLLLGYLPSDRALWPSELAKKRSQYKHFKDDLLMTPSEITRRLDKSPITETDDCKTQSRCLLSRLQVTHDEHPLSLGQSSVWNQFFQDTETIEQIDRDVKRTHPDMEFFSGDTSFAKLNQEALKNILIVFAKLNPGIRYVQGMNEILAPLYYVFRNDPDEENAALLEINEYISHHSFNIPRVTVSKFDDHIAFVDD